MRYHHLRGRNKLKLEKKSANNSRSLHLSNRYMNKELEGLASNLGKRTVLHENDLQLILSKFNRVTFSRKEVIIQSGQVYQFIYYVSSGLLRTYLLTKEGKERVIMFGFEDWWITDIASFTTGKPSSLYLDVLKDCVLYSLSKVDFDELIHESPAFESVFRKMMQYAYMREQQRALELITDSAQDRYLRLVAKYPAIEQEVSQRNIASYLGISPEFLSSLKADLKKQKS